MGKTRPLADPEGVILDTSAVCRVCQGKVVERVSTHFDPRSGPVILGGTDSFLLVEQSYFCGECGLRYEFPPPPLADPSVPPEPEPTPEKTKPEKKSKTSLPPPPEKKTKRPRSKFPERTKLALAALRATKKAKIG